MTYFVDVYESACRKESYSFLTSDGAVDAAWCALAAGAVKVRIATPLGGGKYDRVVVSRKKALELNML